MCYVKRENKISSARTLKISYIGLKTQEVPIKAGTIRILMKPDAEVLEEVVVTGMQKWTNAFLLVQLNN